jgi:hypothetical protein
MLFGLACEGPTDQITIENILCGYFGNPDLDADITKLQPPFDETDQKQGTGGWPILLKYLASARFRDDILNTEFIEPLAKLPTGKRGKLHMTFR